MSGFSELDPRTGGVRSVASADPVANPPDWYGRELAALLAGPTGSAQEVLAAQGRFCDLLRRNGNAPAALPAVLRYVVVAARERADAAYAALGVIGPDGMLDRFVHAGMDADAAPRIGALPRGHGVLGLPVSEPIRLTDLTEHPAAAGFPAHHPPMRSYLGAPVRVREHRFGSLYVTDSATGEFSAEDERLVSALAETAGVALDEARSRRGTS
ncbi:MAG TPA: GAF domain-containing protein [Mycobacterium sp.]|nr:GAF domain-containing protein [Mycobacterium sp.]